MDKFQKKSGFPDFYLSHLSTGFPQVGGGAINALAFLSSVSFSISCFRSRNPRNKSFSLKILSRLRARAAFKWIRISLIGLFAAQYFWFEKGSVDIGLKFEEMFGSHCVAQLGQLLVR